jgi:hypothetical protein
MAAVAGSGAAAGRACSLVNMASEYIPPAIVISASTKITAMVLMVSFVACQYGKSSLTSRRKRDFQPTDARQGAQMVRFFVGGCQQVARGE